MNDQPTATRIDPGICATCPAAVKMKVLRPGGEFECRMVPPAITHFVIPTANPAARLDPRQPAMIPQTGQAVSNAPVAATHWCWMHPARVKWLHEMYRQGGVIPSPYTMHMFEKKEKTDAEN